MTVDELEPDEELEKMLAALEQAEAEGDRRKAIDISRFLDDLRIWRPQTFQLPPEGDWWIWVARWGRGAGKSDTGSWYVNEHMMGPPCDPRVPGGHRGIIAGPTFDSVIAACVQAPSGVLGHNRDVEYVTRRGGTMLVWPNGSEALILAAHTAHDAERLRGTSSNRCIFWLDEAAVMRHLHLAVDNIALGARLGPDPRGIVTSTPKPTPAYMRLLKMPGVIETVASTYDNRFLPASYKHIASQYEGSRLGRQELHAELLTEYEGALWSHEQIDGDRILDFPDGELERMAAMRVVRSTVGLDPSTWDPELGSDPGTVGEGLETGIVVVGIDDQDPPHIYVFDDVSLRAAAKVWAGETLGAWRAWRTDHIAAEVNLGGMVLNTLRAVDPDVVLYKEKGKVGVRAKHSKRVRAEPVAALYDQHRVHHVGYFPALESQMVSWDPRENWSPDRIDALVYAVTALDPWRMSGGTSESSAATLLAAGSLAGPRRGF